MARPPDHLEAWNAALERYARDLASYVAVVDDLAQKARPEARAVYRRALAAAEALRGAPEQRPEDGLRGAALAERAFARYAALESLRKGLDAGAAAALESGLLEGATRRMSRTFIEDATRKARALRAASPQAAAAARSSAAALTAVWAPLVAAADGAEAVAALFAAGPQSEPGAALFAQVLGLWLGAGRAVEPLVEAAKAGALGLAPDTPAAAAAAAARRARLHPIQAMGITFGLAPSERPSRTEAAAAVVIGATLPQAKTAVRYDMAPLVDARAASAFGPIASMGSGLSYRLVQRLETITETAVSRASGRAPAIRLEPGAAAKVVRTIDSGATFRELVPPPRSSGGVSAAAYAAVGAGPKPRVARLGELLEAAVFGPGAPGPPRTLASPEKLVEAFAKAGDAEPRLSLDELSQRLVSKFAADFDLAPPAAADDFLAAVLGERGSRDVYRTYIARAISETFKQDAERRLLRREVSGARGGGALFGSRPMARRGGRQEALLTAVGELKTSIVAARSQLARAYGRLDGEARARRVFAGAPRGRRGAALALYRKVVAEAFAPPRGRGARVVEKLETVEPRLSLKLFVLERGVAS